jgi:hypothetical protein
MDACHTPSDFTIGDWQDYVKECDNAAELFDCQVHYYEYDRKCSDGVTEICMAIHVLPKVSLQERLEAAMEECKDA